MTTAADAASPPDPPPDGSTSPADPASAGETPPAGPAGRPRRVRGEQTRELILGTALRLFQERGYAETTMRAIAREAGVAVGNAYYYFDSKEHLIQGFYDQNQLAHRSAAARVFASERTFAGRLRGVLHAGIDVNAPYHAFAGTFFKTAADPSSPLSPFSPASAPSREAAIGLFREVVSSSGLRLDPQLRAQLPELLWLGWMGVILFWVHDGSPDQRRTRMLIDGAVPLIDKVVKLSRLPVMRPALHQALGLITALRGT
ncbi:MULTISPECIES: TetR family transcriptional regulator [unclassified Actinoplanes]|uniref:TetR family transcriptional regulator n=1 Tax=unclassified Actinoplanes TaxID=2626549 RepID=UPI001E46C3E3|nr:MULTISPECIES: TetR family transcriptional regulator [unclassified Actinoplanes]